jgi:hypothetical protein
MTKFMDRTKTVAKKFIAPSYMKAGMTGYFGVSRAIMFGPEAAAVAAPFAYFATGALEALWYIGSELEADYYARRGIDIRAAEKSA